MRRFQFNLESVLRYRDYLEHVARLEVARVRTDVLTCENNIAIKIKDYDKARQDLEKATSSGIDSDRFKLFNECLRGMESFVKSEGVRRQELLQVLTKKQKELERKTISKKVMENLKDRRKEEYYKEMLKNMYKETDDMIILRKAKDIHI